MSLFVMGVNHHHAGVAVRENFAFSLDETPRVVQALCAQRAVEEAVVLSTCNRTEIYTVTKCHHAVKEWLRTAQYQLPHYEWHDEAVVTHLMHVASGVDSMIVGETQILGQLRQAYQLADAQGGIGQTFRHLFPAVFATAKRVRTKTKISAQPVSLAYTVMQLGRPFFPILNTCTVLLIGAGETIELLADYLKQRGVKRLMIMNRTVEKAHEIACRCGGIPLGLDALEHYLPEADWIISATSSPQSVVSYESMRAARAIRQQKSLQKSTVIADLAVPRDVDPRVAELEGVQLYNMDDVQAAVAENQQSRFVAAEAARTLIAMESAHYMRLLRVREAGERIQQYRAKMVAWRDEALARAVTQLSTTKDVESVLAELARNLTNKFMHLPTVKLRQAAYAERGALMDLLKEMYEL